MKRKPIVYETESGEKFRALPPRELEPMKFKTDWIPTTVPATAAVLGAVAIFLVAGSGVGVVAAPILLGFASAYSGMMKRRHRGKQNLGTTPFSK